MQFRPCINRTACTEDGTHCRSCGRSHDEINRTRILTTEVTRFVKEMGYENPEQFLDYLQRKVLKKLKASSLDAENT